MHSRIQRTLVRLLSSPEQLHKRKRHDTPRLGFAHRELAAGRFVARKERSEAVMRAPPGRCSLGAVTTTQPTPRSSRQPARCWIWRYRSTFRSLLQELETSMQRVKAALAAMPHYHAPDRARRAQGKSKGLILSWHGEGCLADAQEDRRRFRAVHAQCMSKEA
jgi:hypothetical protein